VNIDVIREFARQEPFAPFVIRLSNGESHEVHHPECVALTKAKVIVTYPDEERTVHCSLLHVNAIELLQQA